MPLKLSNLTASTQKDVRIAVGDDALTVTFDQSKYTPLLETQMQKYVENEQPGGLMITMLAEVLCGWDLVSEDGKTPLPFTRETLEKLPIAFLSRIVEGIGAANSPDPQSAEPGGATF